MRQNVGLFLSCFDRAWPPHCHRQNSSIRLWTYHTIIILEWILNYNYNNINTFACLYTILCVGRLLRPGEDRPARSSRSDQRQASGGSHNPKGIPQAYPPQSQQIRPRGSAYLRRDHVRRCPFATRREPSPSDFCRRQRTECESETSHSNDGGCAEPILEGGSQETSFSGRKYIF